MSIEIHVLVATVPWRREPCQHLLNCLKRQTRMPDAVELVLDGYGEVPGPLSPPSLWKRTRFWRSSERMGPGGRWRVAKELPPEAVLVVFDDDVDISQAPCAIERLAAAVLDSATPVAVSASGIAPNGATIRWDSRYSASGAAAYDGSLISLIASAMAVRAKHLVGLREFVDDLSLPLDPLSVGGDDEAPLAAHLWTQGVALKHVQGLDLRLAGGTQDRSQLAERTAHENRNGLRWDWQRMAVKNACGWPWPDANR